jgi:predicted transposase/invertase (TIGR01784 family)
MSKIKQLVRFDWFIKNLLRDKADFEILEGFLSELLKEDIAILEIVESEGNKKSKLDKFNRVDILVKTSNDERVIIEVQNTKELDYLQRILYGTSKTLSETIKEGEAYKNVKRLISISIVYFEIGQGEDYIYFSENSFIGIHKRDRLKLSAQQIAFFENKIQTVEQIFPNYYLIRAADFDGNVQDGLDEWVYFFKTAKVQGKFKAKGLAKAKKRLDVAQLSDQERAEYEYYLESLRSDASYNEQIKFEAKKMAVEIANEMAVGIASEMAVEIANEMAVEIANEMATERVQEKEIATREEIATNLLNSNVDIDTIIMVTKLSKSQIEAIKTKK